jgi:hypothetical protein
MKRMNVCSVIMGLSLGLLFNNCFAHNSNIRIKNDTVYKKQDLLSLDKITKLPFGDQALIDFKFPKKWMHAVDAIDKLKGPIEKASDKLDQFYYHLNAVKSIKPILIINIKFVPSKNAPLINKKYYNFKHGIKYRLPDFGPYQCYYHYLQFSYPVKVLSTDHREYLEIGSIVLYDPKTKTANVLNIFDSYTSDGADDFWGVNNYFYIDSTKKITIYKSVGEETESTMEKSQEITIQDDGKILVKNFKTTSTF